MGLNFSTSRGQKPENPEPFVHAGEKMFGLFELPINGNPHGRIFERAEFPILAGSLGVLAELLDRYKKIIPEKGKVSLYLETHPIPWITRERPTFIIDYKLDGKIWKFSYGDAPSDMRELSEPHPRG